MAKFCGKIGFSKTVEREDQPGVWDDDVVERSYTGDIIRNMRRWDNSQYVNDDLNITNSISIVADSFACCNAYLIKYVCWMGAKWKVTSVDVQRPRLILSLGGVYNDGD